MATIIGSARIDEYGKATGGKPGDQKQKVSERDTIGEVSQQNFYISSKGWYILRPKMQLHRERIAKAMITACDNSNIGYSQSERLGVIKYGVDAKQPTNADCSSLIRACIIAGADKDVGNFTTYNEAKILENSGLFEKRVKFISEKETPLNVGDVLVTCSKGHTVIVTKTKTNNSTNTSDHKNNSEKVEYYPKYKGDTLSIVLALKAVGEKDWSFAHRQKIAEANNIKNYEGNAKQNVKLVTLIKNGKLKKA